MKGAVRHLKMSTQLPASNSRRSGQPGSESAKPRAPLGRPFCVSTLRVPLPQGDQSHDARRQPKGSGTVSSTGCGMSSRLALTMAISIARPTPADRGAFPANARGQWPYAPWQQRKVLERLELQFALGGLYQLKGAVARCKLTTSRYRSGPWPALQFCGS